MITNGLRCVGAFFPKESPQGGTLNPTEGRMHRGGGLLQHCPRPLAPQQHPKGVLGELQAVDGVFCSLHHSGNFQGHLIPGLGCIGYLQGGEKTLWVPAKQEDKGLEMLTEDACVHARSKAAASPSVSRARSPTDVGHSAELWKRAGGTLTLMRSRVFVWNSTSILSTWMSLG